MSVAQEQPQIDGEKWEFHCSNNKFFYWTVVVSCSFNFLFNFYLDCRQLRSLLQAANKVPSVLQSYVDLVTFEKTRLYAIDHTYLRMFTSVWNNLLLMALFYFQLLPELWLLTNPMVSDWLPISWNQQVIHSMNFAFTASILYIVYMLPVYVGSTLLVENRHDYKPRQSVLESVLSNIIPIPCAALIVSLMAGLFVFIVGLVGQFFFLWFWVLASVCSVFDIALAPKCIKFCNIFPSVREGTLLQRFKDLALRVQFPLEKVYVTKRIQMGDIFCKMVPFAQIVCDVICVKGIVIIDSGVLKKLKSSVQINVNSQTKCSEKRSTFNKLELDALIAHGLGHWKLNHLTYACAHVIYASLIEVGLTTFLFMNPILYQAFGFTTYKQELPILLGVGLCYLLSTWFRLNREYFGNFLAQRFEFEADAVAAKLGYGELLKTAMVKLNKSSFGFLPSDKLYSVLREPPTLLQRLEEMEKLANGLEETQIV